MAEDPGPEGDRQNCRRRKKKETIHLDYEHMSGARVTNNSPDLNNRRAEDHSQTTPGGRHHWHIADLDAEEWARVWRRPQALVALVAFCDPVLSLRQNQEALARHECSPPPPVEDPTTPLCSEVWSRDSDDEIVGGSQFAPGPGLGGDSKAPVVIVFFLWAVTAINSDVVRQGFVGANGVQPLNIMAMFISLAYLSVSLDRTGLFGFLAVWVAKRGKSSGRRLFLLLYLFFFACSMLFGNDPVTLSGTPFLAHFVRYSGIDPPTAWIFSQFIRANTSIVNKACDLGSSSLTSSHPSSAILPPSNPTNLVVATHTVVPTLLVAISQFILLRYIQFNSSALIPKTFTVVAVQVFHETEDVELSVEVGSPAHPGSSEGQHIGQLSDKPGAVFGSVLFVSTLLVLLGTSVKHIPMWYVTAPSAVAMGIRDIFHDRGRWDRRSVQSTTTNESKANDANTNAELIAQRSALRRFQHAFEYRLPAFSKWCKALTVSGWIEVFAKWWSAWVNVCGPADSLRAVVGSVFGMSIVSVLMCNFCGTNIGATIFLSQIVLGWLDMVESSRQPVNPRLRLAVIYSMALGVNFGAYSFAFSASLAGLLWKGILENNGINRIKIRQRDFALQNIPSVAVAIAVSAVAILVEVVIVER
ncbi:hypothetical protein SCHPADRAFT_938982 [Schizopora paradoxa]|uniref:Citrate transporter-like domain-containing protein n=1 Tax=Schizopora paradoxa TaxID=27342 RepID=A0A0H2SDN5_9AGAM|nr:hypothetical protein SCHPADRAFT_938982 [Schizopora paradoxa]